MCRESFSTKVRRLYQSSFIVGVAMVLIVSPHLVVDLYADCREDCAQDFESTVRAAVRARELAYDVCNENYRIAYNAYKEQFDFACNACSANAQNNLVTAGLIYASIVAGCITAGPWYGVCVALAYAAYQVTIASILLALQTCYNLATATFQSNVNAAVQTRNVCLNAADITYNRAWADAFDELNRCVARCE